MSFYAQPAEPLAASYQSQDDFGQYSYGYSNEDSYKNEQRTADGIVRGSYSYVDANGKLQVVHYISDAAGFRVSATNLPKAPIAPELPQPEVEPANVMDARKGKSEEQVAPVVPVVPSHYYAPNYAYAPTYTYAATATPVSPNPSSQFHAQVGMFSREIYRKFSKIHQFLTSLYLL